MSVNATVAVADCLFSNAHCWTAPSIWRRLLMQAFIWDCVRARTKLGIAIAAKRPMMATTIMISTRVKPDFFVVLIFILLLLLLLFFWGERHNRRVNYNYSCRSQIARCAQPSLSSIRSAIP